MAIERNGMQNERTAGTRGRRTITMMPKAITMIVRHHNANAACNKFLVMEEML